MRKRIHFQLERFLLRKPGFPLHHQRKRHGVAGLCRSAFLLVPDKLLKHLTTAKQLVHMSSVTSSFGVSYIRSEASRTDSISVFYLFTTYLPVLVLLLLLILKSDQ